MNRHDRRAINKDKERVVVSGIVVHFANGQYVQLDTGKVMVVDKDTNRPLFEQVLDAQPAKIDSPISTPKPSKVASEFDGEANTEGASYSVTFDTPEGRMVYVKKGNWSGVRPAVDGE